MKMGDGLTTLIEFMNRNGVGCGGGADNVTCVCIKAARSVGAELTRLHVCASRQRGL